MIGYLTFNVNPEICRIRDACACQGSHARDGFLYRRRVDCLSNLDSEHDVTPCLLGMNSHALIHTAVVFFLVPAV
ncbi:MAG: hypothetical protein ACLVJ6_12365 [Merdibacter sp.]